MLFLFVLRHGKRSVTFVVFLSLASQKCKVNTVLELASWMNFRNFGNLAC